MITSSVAAQILGRIGGSRSTPKKKLAAQRRQRQIWEEIRGGLRPLPPNWKSTPKWLRAQRMAAQGLAVGVTTAEIRSADGRMVLRDGHWMVIAAGEPLRKP